MNLHLKQRRNQHESEQQQPSAKIPKLLLDLHHQHASSEPSSALPLFVSSDQSNTKISGNMSTSLSDTNTRMGNNFSLAQWQELRLQALIYRYMLAGAAVPPELLQPIKKSLLYSSNFLHHPISHHQPPLSIMDPEPRRCRRTDGKKWRCYEDVVTGHKYCKRHVNRGRNRSRKPVEMSLTSNSTSVTIANNNAATRFGGDVSGAGSIGCGVVKASSPITALPFAAMAIGSNNFGLSRPSPPIDLLQLNHRGQHGLMFSKEISSIGVDLKSLVAGYGTMEQTSRFLQIPEERTFCRHAPTITEEADEEDDVEVIDEPNLAPKASYSTPSTKAKSTPKMSFEEIKRSALKRKNPSPTKVTFNAVSSFLSPPEGVKLTPVATPKVEGEVTISFPANFLSCGQGFSISRVDADKLLFPAPRCQLSALPPGQVCDEGSALLMHALQHSLVTRQTIKYLQLEVVVLKTKAKGAIESREKTEERALRVERSLAERDAEVRKLNERIALMMEEAKDVEPFIVMKTRAQVFKQFLEGNSVAWDAQGELDFFLTNIGDAADLGSGDNV